MADINTAQEKYRSKVGQMERNYAAGMSRFFGQDVSGSLPVRNYKGAINDASAAKWASNMRGAFGI